MKNEESAGLIVFRKSRGELAYLLLKDGLGYWGFPKGHLQSKETLTKAALRETKEESGIEEIELQPGFQRWTHYFFQKNGEKISKRVCFFLGKAKNQKVILSSEHQDYQWLSYPQARERLGFKNARLLLKEAQVYLSSN